MTPGHQELGFAARALAVELGIWIGGAFMGVVGAAMAVKVILAVAPGRWWLAGAILRSKALHRPLAVHPTKLRLASRCWTSSPGGRTPLVMHGEDDQIVPFANSGPLSAELLRHSTFKAYPRLPHGMPTTHADQINADLLAFIRA